MLKKILIEILIVCLVICALKLTFDFGHRVATRDAEEIHAKKKMEEAAELHRQLFELDRSFLTSLPTHPVTLTSGTYLLNVQYAGQAAKSFPVTATFTSGRLVGLTMTTFRIEKLAQLGSFVSWEQHHMDGDEGPSASFIGLVDGNQMCGKVYMPPGDGWHEGEPPACGVWYLRPPSVLSTTGAITN